MTPRYTQEDIDRMTPPQREAAQLQVLREWLDTHNPRRRRYYAQRNGRLGGLAIHRRRTCSD